MARAILTGAATHPASPLTRRAQKLTGTTAGAPRLPCLQDRRWPPTPTVVLLLVLHQERGV